MRRTTRWHSGVVASIALVSAGVFFGSGPLLVSAIVPLSYLGYAALSSVPDPRAALSVERTFRPRTPLPGERVTVTLTVRNRSERTLPDVRIVDRLPSDLEVIEGTTAAGATLRPGETVAISYTLRPRRGTYTFDDPWVRIRSLSATAVATATLPCDGETELECTVPVDELPIHRETIPYAGAIASDSGGPGFEFHSTREYQQGDPLSRVDWRRYARSRELGTVQYREQRASKVVIVVDGRSVAAVARAAGRPTGTTLAAYTALLTSSILTSEGHSVGLVGLGVRGEQAGVYAGPPAYVEPGTRGTVRGRIAQVCDAIAAREPAGAARPTPGSGGSTAVRSDGDGRLDHLDSVLPADAQLVVCSPLVDDEIVDLITGLCRRGYRSSVIAPNLAGRDDVGARLAAIEHRVRRARLRRVGAAVVEWDTDVPLATLLEHRFATVMR